MLKFKVFSIATVMNSAIKAIEDRITEFLIVPLFLTVSLSCFLSPQGRLCS